MSKKRHNSPFGLSGEDYGAILSQLPRLIMVIDQAATIRYWNKAGLEVFGYTAEEVLGKKKWVLYPFLSEREFQYDLELMEEGGILSKQIEGRRKDGSFMWVDLKQRMISLEDHNALILGSVSDISEQIKTKRDLLLSKARMGAILETAVEGIITINREGVMQSFNAAAEEIFGYTADEVLGQNVKILMPGPYRQQHDNYIKNYLRTGHAKIIGSGREVRGKRKDGSIFPMNLAVSEVKFNGNLIFTGFVRDISERRRLENEILQASEEERQRIGRDLHDGLGQMLTGIRLISKNLARKLKANGLPGAGEVEGISEMIQEADEQAKALAHGLVHRELESETFSESIQSLCERSRRFFNIQCKINVDKGVDITNKVSILHLYRIIQEAISNAVKHGGASEVKVHIKREESYFKIIVEDNGKGFSNYEDRKKLKGKGIGLSTMSYRAHILGGHINIEESETGHTLLTCSIPKNELQNKESE